MVVPVYNEALALPKFVEKFESVFNAFRRPFELVFVDDGSTDTTPEILRDLRLSKKFVKIVTLDKNYGVEAALCAGFHFSEGILLLQMPVDLQYSPEDALKIVEAASAPDKPDMIACYAKNRVQCDDTSARALDAKRINAKLGGRLSDPICSLRLYAKKLVERAESYNGNTYSPSLLLPRMSKRMAEIEVVRYPRSIGANRMPRGIRALPLSFQSAWTSFNLLSITAITAGAVMALTAILSMFLIKEVVNPQLLLVVAVIGLVGGIASIFTSLSARSIVGILLPLPEPIRYNTKDTGSPRFSGQSRQNYRSQRQPRPQREQEPKPEETQQKEAPLPKPTGPVTFESVVLNGEKNKPQPPQQQDRDNDRRQYRGPRRHYNPRREPPIRRDPPIRPDSNKSNGKDRFNGTNTYNPDE